MKTTIILPEYHWCNSNHSRRVEQLNKVYQQMDCRIYCEFNSITRYTTGFWCYGKYMWCSWMDIYSVSAKPTLQKSVSTFIKSFTAIISNYQHLVSVVYNLTMNYNSNVKWSVKLYCNIVVKCILYDQNWCSYTNGNLNCILSRAGLSRLFYIVLPSLSFCREGVDARRVDKQSVLVSMSLNRLGWLFYGLGKSVACKHHFAGCEIFPLLDLRELFCPLSQRKSH